MGHYSHDLNEGNKGFGSYSQYTTVADDSSVSNIQNKVDRNDPTSVSNERNISSVDSNFVSTEQKVVDRNSSVSNRYYVTGEDKDVVSSNGHNFTINCQNSTVNGNNILSSNGHNATFNEQYSTAVTNELVVNGPCIPVNGLVRYYKETDEDGNDSGYEIDSGAPVIEGGEQRQHINFIQHGRYTMDTMPCNNASLPRYVVEKQPLRISTPEQRLYTVENHDRYDTASLSNTNRYQPYVTKHSTKASEHQLSNTMQDTNDTQHQLSTTIQDTNATQHQLSTTIQDTNDTQRQLSTTIQDTNATQLHRCATAQSTETTLPYVSAQSTNPCESQLYATKQSANAIQHQPFVTVQSTDATHHQLYSTNQYANDTQHQISTTPQSSYDQQHQLYTAGHRTNTDKGQIFDSNDTWSSCFSPSVALANAARTNKNPGVGLLFHHPVSSADASRFIDGVDTMQARSSSCSATANYVVAEDNNHLTNLLTDEISYLQQGNLKEKSLYVHHGKMKAGVSKQFTGNSSSSSVPRSILNDKVHKVIAKNMPSRT